ncbi:flagellar protein FlaG [Virgibacillus halodenitrificans]|nr:flagellar protein FlaG [Virgibacillus halodenitrificans]
MRLEQVSHGSQQNKLQGNNTQLLPDTEKSQQHSRLDGKVLLPTDNTITKDKLRSVTEKLNEFVEPLKTDLKFVFHEKLNEYYVTVVNPLTDEVIKEIPPKKMLDMYADMAELMGLMIDEKI